jgi:hypothetical protein
MHGEIIRISSFEIRKWVEQKEFRAVPPHSLHLILWRDTKVRNDRTCSSFKTYRALPPLFLAMGSLELARQQLHHTLHVPRAKNKVSRGNDTCSTKYYSCLSHNFFIAMPCRLQQLLQLKRQHSFTQIFHFLCTAVANTDDDDMRVMKRPRTVAPLQS